MVAGRGIQLRQLPDSSPRTRLGFRENDETPEIPGSQFFIADFLFEIEWRHFGHRYFDFDLRWIDFRSPVDPIRHRRRPENHDRNKDNHCSDPGNCSPIDLRCLDRFRRDAAQIKQCEAKWRMHETRLNVRANENTKPDQVDAKLFGSWSQHRNNDERDFEEIEEKRDNENERVCKN